MHLECTFISHFKKIFNKKLKILSKNLVTFSFIYKKFSKIVYYVSKLHIYIYIYIYWLDHNFE